MLFLNLMLQKLLFCLFTLDNLAAVFTFTCGILRIVTFSRNTLKILLLLLLILLLLFPFNFLAMRLWYWEFFIIPMRFLISVALLHLVITIRLIFELIHLLVVSDRFHDYSTEFGAEHILWVQHIAIRTRRINRNRLLAVQITEMIFVIRILKIIRSSSGCTHSARLQKIWFLNKYTNAFCHSHGFI